MKRTTFTWLAPPFAIARYGCVACTAAPIGVFWLASLVSLGYGLLGGRLGGLPGSEWFLVSLGVVLWLISAVWSRLVVGGADDDLSGHQESSLKRRVIPHLDESDPLQELSKGL
jgi:hypothetical protein